MIARLPPDLPVSQPGPAAQPVGFGVIGVGLIGSHHAANLARRVPGARLVGLADPQPGVAERAATALGCQFWTRDVDRLLGNPEIEAVVIASPAAVHVDAIVACAQAGKAIFCEKPLANTLAEADLAIKAVGNSNVAFQIGFQRRFDLGFVGARALVDRGELGQIHLLRSLTRDPVLDNPEFVSPGAIFLETMIHDFDVLRFLAWGAEPVEVYATADALIRPDLKSRGLLDSAVVTLRYDTGAMATADSSLQAVYGYDVRAEVFGSEGMASIGDGIGPRLVHHTRAGSIRRRPNWFIDVFADAYRAELAHFSARVRGQVPFEATLGDARAALVLALAAIRSVETRRPVATSDVSG
jgi:myo-inositol 2-dehydrogenase/D-chiro-inositol 1-dehydrogenase